MKRNSFELISLSIIIIISLSFIMQECIINEIQLKVFRNIFFSSVVSMFMSNINEFFITLKGQVLG